MMNEGGITDTLTTLGQNKLEKHQVVDSSQGYTSYYTSSTDNGIPFSSSYHQDQRAEPPPRTVQDGPNVASLASTSSSGTVNLPQEYNSYATYPNTDQYGYGNTGYAGYYSGFKQQSNQSYPQPVGAYQNTGAPYQPLSSFQNTGSYAGPTSYSSTYYNPGDYQTSGGYTSGGYNNQTNSWNLGNYASYASHQYSNYTSDQNGAYNASVATPTSVQNQQHYKQWADYYSQTEVSCAPGTENISVSSTSNPVCPVRVTSGYSASFSQAPAPYVPTWKPDSSSSELLSMQTGGVTSGGHDYYWNNGTPVQNYNISQHQPQFQKPLDSNPTYQSFQDQQKSACPQGPNGQYPATHQVLQSYPSSLQTVPQTIPPLDTHRVSKLQIPTNPRIASNLALGLPNTNKDSSTTSAAAKPAYISVSLPKPNDMVVSHAAADSILKPGMFPKSLRGYVERALSRCRDDTQMTSCQATMKEVITKATADGTLYTRDWDTEPLFPLPSMDMTNKDLEFSTPISSLSKSKRSPSRRSKSRWEPVPEIKPVDKPASVTLDSVKYGGLLKFSESDKKLSGGKLENKGTGLSSVKFSLSDQRTTDRNALKPVKRQRLDNGLTTDNGDASSDSDKEQSLTAYYSGAITLVNSPEERKRRENRSKRFDRGPGNRAENNRFRPKNVGAGNLYSRRASALVLSKNFEDGGSRAVEDIDWDALTVKGTCQEIEKRYLRLTSAPDPATVRPEEVLEKALLIVQNSQKNYLYKCDQLKSIRQDLTVQRIRNELTVKVYETHARLAIEVGDLAEYNQCQSQLKTLYAEGIKGCHLEFSAYNLLCVILHSSNNRDLLSAMSRLSVEARKDEALKHALAVRAAVTSGNYVLFFRLYKTAPNLNTCLMDLYVEKMRYAAVRCMSRSYRPTVPVSYIAQVLGFTNASPSIETSEEKDSDGLEECVEWLKAHGACLAADNTEEMQLDTKASTSTLFMPEPEDAVSHGDASLAVNDFLTRNPS
ncbi:SAC3 family protein A-like isoform X2 [Actinidia eriantha]|uniref:SAC3 family protein A-like isoform X2 n=1 Tax=Actinidia eriantha TaxID=165200 RepID=UPI00258BD9C0|nr:SAC3 family protein A-like isoform X2 [Actinidia eriantha]